LSFKTHVTYTWKLFTWINCPIYPKKKIISGWEKTPTQLVQICRHMRWNRPCGESTWGWFRLFHIFFLDKPLTKLRGWFGHPLRDIMSDPTTIHNYYECFSYILNLKGWFNHHLALKDGWTILSTWLGGSTILLEIL
jgi:hypothetical protein